MKHIINFVNFVKINIDFVEISLVVVVFIYVLGFSIPVVSFTGTIRPSILPKIKIDKDNLGKGNPGSNLSLGLRDLPPFV